MHSIQELADLARMRLGQQGNTAAGAAARFLSRKIGRKVQDRLEQAMSTVAAKQQDTLQQLR